MKHCLRPFVRLCFVFLIPYVAQAAEAINAPHLRISWLAPQTFGTGAETIGIYYELEPGWHVYWRNPGDSGTAPKFTFETSEASVGPMLWPRPKRIFTGPLVTFGYEGSAGFLFSVTPKASANGETVRQLNLSAKLEWLVCQAACLPGHGDLDLRRVVLGAQSQWTPSQRTLMDHLLKLEPAASEAAPWTVSSVKIEDAHVRVELIPKGEDRTVPEVFPLDGGFLAPQPPVIENKAKSFDLLFSVIAGRAAPDKTAFLIANGDSSWVLDSISVQAAVSSANASLELKSESSSLILLLLSAFAGGLILNLMPCVLPILFIKFLALGRTDLPASARVRDGLLYSAGVLLSFAALGGLLLAVRAAGSAVGWGFQLQSPLVVLFLSVLFWLMALNFLGVFEFGSSLMGWAGSFKNAGSFGTGVLSVVIAAPCTGPFMGSAIGAATVLPTWMAMCIFLGLGAGLAAPYLLLASSPALLRLLPKPGAWMEKLKQFFAFPLIGTVLWLFWILGAQSGSNGPLLAGSLLLIISFALWLARSGVRYAKPAAWIVALGALVLVSAGVRAASDLTSAATDTDWVRYDESALQAARDEHRAVFVDFTAAWCLTCQVNKRLVLTQVETRKLFKGHEVLTMEADWTKQDPVITMALARFGRNSVPVYAFYPADGGAVQILPQILTYDLIHDLFQP